MTNFELVYKQLEPKANRITNENFCYVNALTVLESLEPYLLSDYDTEYILTEWYEANPDITIIESGNSYNWGGRITNDFNYTEVELDGITYTIFSFHIGTDIRAGYTNDLVVEGNLFDALRDIPYHAEVLEIDGNSYYLEYNIFSDMVAVFEEDTDDDIGEINPVYRGDAIKEIKHLVDVKRVLRSPIYKQR